MLEKKKFLVGATAPPVPRYVGPCRDLLVTAKISSNFSNSQLPSGSFRCGKNCATWPYIFHRLTTYTT